MGWRLQKTGMATPAGIKQVFPIYPKASANLKWSSKAVKGLVYMVTDKARNSSGCGRPGNQRNLGVCAMAGRPERGVSVRVPLGRGWQRAYE